MNPDKKNSLKDNHSNPEPSPVSGDSLAGFIAEMHKQDTRCQRSHRLMAFCLFPMGIFFLTFGVSGNPAIGLLGFGFILAIAYMLVMAQLYRKIDYSTPVSVYLSKSAQRYKFFTVQRALMVLPILLIMGYAGGWSIWNSAMKYFNPGGGILALVAYGCFFVALCAFAIYVEWKKWKRETAPLLDAINQHLQQFASDHG